MIIYYAVPVFSQLLTAAAAVALLSGACKCQQKEVQNLKKKIQFVLSTLVWDFCGNWYLTGLQELDGSSCESELAERNKSYSPQFC